MTRAGRFRGGRRSAAVAGVAVSAAALLGGVRFQAGPSPAPLWAHLGVAVCVDGCFRFSLLGVHPRGEGVCV